MHASPESQARAPGHVLRGSRLELRFVGALLAMLVAIMLVFALINYHSTRESVLASLTEQSERVVTRLENALAVPLWSYDENAAASYLRAEMEDGDLLAILIEEYELSDDSEDPELWLGYAREEAGGQPRRIVGTDIERPQLEEAFARAKGEISHEAVSLGTVTVYFSDRSAQMEIRRQVITTAAVTAVLGIAIALTTSLLLHRMVISPLQALLARLEGVAAGDYRSTPDYHRDDEIGVLTKRFEEMVATVAARETTLRDSVEEKAAMLREIHHRVKNNFQVLSSIMNLQKHNVPDDALPALENSEHRIRSMEMVHEKLYESANLAHIDIGNYITELIELLRVSRALPAERVTVSADDVSLPLDTAVPLGLIVNEVVTNACRHVLVHSQDTRVEVRFEVSEKHARLSVQDTGPGFPSDMDVTSGKSLGLRLVYALVEQIHGTINLDSPPEGARVVVEFPMQSENQEGSR